jgi:dehydrogenase/reductase SDR family member 12
VITERWARELEGTGIVVHAMHPGWVDTEGVRNWMPVFRTLTRLIIRDPDAGADSIVWLGAAEEPLRSSGRFWHDRRIRPTNDRLGASEDGPQEREELWRYRRTLLQAADIPVPG